MTAIPGTTYIDFDLSGLYDRCPLCFVVGYDIDVRREDYFEARREWIKAVIMVFLAHDLPPTGDTIEDYGAKLLFCAPYGQNVGGDDPRLIILFIVLLPFMVIWETAKNLEYHSARPGLSWGGFSFSRVSYTLQ